jgi:hypothetical protein
VSALCLTMRPQESDVLVLVPNNGEHTDGRTHTIWVISVLDRRRGKMKEQFILRLDLPPEFKLFRLEPWIRSAHKSYPDAVFADREFGNSLNIVSKLGN